MKLTEENKKLLLSWGETEDDLWQIEEATKAKNTKYSLYFDGKCFGQISRKSAIEILGFETYLSGIARSAFHCSAFRSNEKGYGVSFDSNDLVRS